MPGKLDRNKNKLSFPHLCFKKKNPNSCFNPSYYLANMYINKHNGT